MKVANLDPKMGNLIEVAGGIHGLASVLDSPSQPDGIHYKYAKLKSKAIWIDGWSFVQTTEA